MSKKAQIDVSLHPVFFWYIGGVILLFLLSFLWAPLFYVALGALIVVVGVMVYDVGRLYQFGTITAERSYAKILSLGDSNTIRLTISSQAKFHQKFTIIEELPYQLQKRDFTIDGSIENGEKFNGKYTITPKERGVYSFGNTHVLVQSPWGFAERRFTSNTSAEVRVYPSIIQMKRFQLASIEKLQQYHGFSKTRKIGHNYEFEQIKTYVQGDDYRSINWKATSRSNQLMVNQYTDEQSQPVYCLIDKSRHMNLPFNGMTLLDYAINSSLVISNVTLQKKDYIGLVTFRDGIDTMMKASNNPKQLPNILESLYREETSTTDANYPLLYKVMNSLARTRSLIFLFSNIESKHHLDRIMPELLRLHKRHLLVVVFFKNDELEDYANSNAENTHEVYKRTAAAKMVADKRMLIQLVRQHGIHAMYSRPDELTIDSLNKYLELKARGLI